MIKRKISPSALAGQALSGQTAAVWRVSTEQLIDRIAANKDVDLREVPLDYNPLKDAAVEVMVDPDDLSLDDFKLQYQAEWDNLKGQTNG